MSVSALPNRAAFTARTAVSGTNPIQKMGFWLMLAFLFIAFSRLFDLKFSYLHLPFILSTLAACATIAYGGIPRAFSSTTSKFLIAFTFWIIACIPFSAWRGGSFTMLQDEWSKSFLCFVLVAGLTVTLKESRQVMFTLGFAALTAAIVALFLGFKVEGRLALPVGLLSNPNDLAQILFLGLPFWSVLVIPRRSVVQFAIVIAASLVLLVTITATGSRSALIAAFTMGALLFLKAPLPKKVIMLSILVIGIAAILVFLPSNLRSRYLTTFSDAETLEKQTEEDLSAFESRNSRWILLKQSIYLTVKHPIFGVGPGVFEVASSRDSKQQGDRSMWRETHNAYTQVSSECGIPGFLFFIGAFGTCLPNLLAIRDRAARDPRFAEIKGLAFCLFLSLIGFMVTSFFSSIAYKFFVPTVLGLAVAFIRTARQEMDTLTAFPARPVAAGVGPATPLNSTRPRPRTPVPKMRL